MSENITSDELRAAGFAEDAKGYPRDEVALRLLCAFVGVDWKTAPPGWWFHPNESTQEAWKRVADEARVVFGEQQAMPRRLFRNETRNTTLEDAALECARHAAWLKKEAHAGGDWQCLMTRADEAVYNAKCIRAMKEAVT